MKRLTINKGVASQGNFTCMNLRKVGDKEWDVIGGGPDV